LGRRKKQTREDGGQTELQDRERNERSTETGPSAKIKARKTHRNQQATKRENGLSKKKHSEGRQKRPRKHIGKFAQANLELKADQPSKVGRGATSKKEKPRWEAKSVLKII